MRETSTVFTVKKSGGGRWAVCETGFEKPLAEFDDRVDALEYARGMAGTKPRASIDAEGDGTSAPVSESYAVDPVTGKSSRAEAGHHAGYGDYGQEDYGSQRRGNS